VNFSSKLWSCSGTSVRVRGLDLRSGDTGRSLRDPPTGPDVSGYALYVLIKRLLIVVSDVRPIGP
jgi:hypothetical protein